tara:strand:+ start:1029 stop:1949 length:921 start_codon:yes stop_codon:yes gene_type:complete
MPAEQGKRRNLGRGLSALFGDESADYASLDQLRLSKMVPTELLSPGKFQPRQLFDDKAMASLVASIREKGVLEPILVRRHTDQANEFEIVAGERRWRAAQIAKLHEVPVVIKDLPDRDALEIALVENIHREDLTVLEEAEAYQRLIEEFDHTQEALAKAVGRSRSHVANMLRLLILPGEIKQKLQNGDLTAGHARALIGSDDPIKLANTIVSKSLNVRQAEALVRRQKIKKDPTRKSTQSKERKDPNTRALERDLVNLLGLKVSIDERGEGGVLTIQFTSLDQLDDVLQRLTRGSGSDHGAETISD